MDIQKLQLNGGGDQDKRRELDFYPNPKKVTIALMEFITSKELFNINNTVLEPCNGNGAMSDVIKKYSNNVLCSDISDDNSVDYLTTDDTFFPDWIITNPPFNISERIIRKAIIDANCVAMLLKSQYWHAKSRLSLFEELKPRYVLPLTWRPDFLEHLRVPGQKTAAPTMEVAWTIWIPGQIDYTEYIPLAKPVQN